MANKIDNFTKKAFTFVLAAALVISVLLLIIYAINIFLLAFAGVLLGILLRGLGSFFSSKSGFSNNLSLILVILIIILFITGFGFLMGPNISEGFNELSDKIPSAVKELETELSHYSWGKRLIENAKSAYNSFVEDPKLASRVTGIFSSTLGTLIYILVVLVIALYTAFEPRPYVEGIVKLVPPQKRERAKEVLIAIRKALSWWLAGRFSSMLIIGVATSIGLWILGVPLAFTLGVLAAVSTFVPNIGPFISAVPAILVGLVESPLTALYVIILYVIIQVTESYVITPLIQKRAVSLPPALLITVQILMGVWIGAFGLLLATPLMVVIIVLVQMLYIEDSLGDKVKVMGDHS